MNWNTIFLILCSIGAIQSFFIGGYFISIRKGRRLSNTILGLLLLAIGLRVAKSTLWLFYGDVSEVILNIGFGAHLTVVPLLMIYISSFDGGFKWRWYYYLHFIPFGAVILLSTELTTANFWYVGGYSALLYHSLVYLLISLFIYVKKAGDEAVFSGKAKVWIRTLYLSVALFCLAYFLNYEMRLTSYMTGPVIYSGIIYFLSFYVLKHHAFFTEDRKGKYRNIQLDADEIVSYRDKIKSIVEDEKCYLQPDFTLSQLSDKTKIAKHLLSNLFNVHLNVSFTDYTNQFRINKAIELLNDPSYDNLKISAIAYECGFNTLSAFNSAFKKNTNATPSEFKKKLTEKIKT